jgi:UDPglucose 6-dehydrogenase
MTEENEVKIEKIGVIGIGVVVKAVFDFFVKRDNIKTIGYDKYKKEYNKNKEKLLECDIIFFCLPTEYKKEIKNYDHSITEEYIKWLEEKEYKGWSIIKSTIEPTKTQEWNEKYNKLKIIHNPEFLTSRTSEEDFINQNHIVIGYTKQTENQTEEIINFYKKNFKNVKISVGRSIETEMMKIWCNSFYAIKIQVFNEIYEHCKKMEVDYENVKTMMLKNEWINPMHTNVPGPDGKKGYGGACFPKDTNALVEHLKRNDIIHGVLESAIKERNFLRQDE